MEQADEERIAELNRRKEEYESRQSGDDRSLADDVNENRRRDQIREQREREEQKAEVEASADRISEGRRKYREKKEVEESASRIAAGRKAYREQRQEIEDSAPLIAEGRRKYREKKEVEETAEHMRIGRQKFREEQDARAGKSSFSGNILDWTLLTPHEKRAAQDEIEKSSGKIAKGRQQYREQKTDEYYKNTSTGKQIFDKMLGRSPTYQKPEPKQVQPIMSFFGGQAYKANQRLSAAKNNFLQEFTRPLKAVNQGRQTRMQRNTRLVDPFGQLAAPQPRRASRTKGTRVPMGTGMLFTEGFFNPTKSGGRRKKSGGRGRQYSGDIWELLL
jgi:hypothetical protein